MVARPRRALSPDSWKPDPGVYGSWTCKVRSIHQARPTEARSTVSRFTRWRWPDPQDQTHPQGQIYKARCTRLRWPDLRRAMRSMVSYIVHGKLHSLRWATRIIESHKPWLRCGASVSGIYIYKHIYLFTCNVPVWSLFYKWSSLTVVRCI